MSETHDVVFNVKKAIERDVEVELATSTRFSNNFPANKALKSNSISFQERLRLFRQLLELWKQAGINRGDGYGSDIAASERVWEKALKLFSISNRAHKQSAPIANFGELFFQYRKHPPSPDTSRWEITVWPSPPSNEELAVLHNQRSSYIFCHLSGEKSVLEEYFQILQKIFPDNRVRTPKEKVKN